MERVVGTRLYFSIDTIGKYTRQVRRVAQCEASEVSYDLYTSIRKRTH
jgi:hypothetical protein